MSFIQGFEKVSLFKCYIYYYFSDPVSLSYFIQCISNCFNLVLLCRKHGMLGLFKGLEAKLLQTVLTAALMFLLYEKIASCTFRVMGLSNSQFMKR